MPLIRIYYSFAEREITTTYLLNTCQARTQLLKSMLLIILSTRITTEDIFPEHCSSNHLPAAVPLQTPPSPGYATVTRPRCIWMHDLAQQVPQQPSSICVLAGKDLPLTYGVLAQFHLRRKILDNHLGAFMACVHKINDVDVGGLHCLS